MGKNVFFIVALSLVSLVATAQAVPFKQMPRGSNNLQIPVTRGANNVMEFRNAETFLVDTLGLLNACCYDSIYRHLDSILLRDGAGFAILPDTSSTNEIEIPAYSTQSGKYLSNNGSILQWMEVPDGGMDSLYNGNRAISRVPAVGNNLGATTFRQWLDWWYIGNYTQPTLTFNTISPTLVEVGSSTAYTFTGSTSNPCGYTLSNGALSSPATHSFGSATSFSKAYTHQPTTRGTTTITASQDWVMTTTSCVAGSPTSGTKTASRTIQNEYPVLWGMSATEYTGGSVPYSIWSKKTVDPINSASITGLTMTGSNMYIYILIPSVTGDVIASSIIDHNTFNVKASFTAYDVTVTSTGLTNNWTAIPYKLYKLNNLTSASGFNYIYNR